MARSAGRRAGRQSGRQSGRQTGRRGAGRQRNQTPRLRVRKGDTVQVIAGPDKGKQGEVVSVDIERHRLTVEGVHVGHKHQRPTQQSQEGQIIDYLLPIDVSNVAVVCPRTGKPGRVGYRFEGARKVRYHRVSGEELP